MWYIYFVMKQYDPTRTLIMLIVDNYDDPPKIIRSSWLSRPIPRFYRSSCVIKLKVVRSNGLRKGKNLYIVLSLETHNKSSRIMKEICKKWLKIDIFNKWNIVKEILDFYQELCVSENERMKKKTPKHWNMFISHRQNSKIDNENTKLLDASLLQTM